jgi:hypothetical protein
MSFCRSPHFPLCVKLDSENFGGICAIFQAGLVSAACPLPNVIWQIKTPEHSCQKSLPRSISWAYWVVVSVILLLNWAARVTGYGHGSFRLRVFFVRRVFAFPSISSLLFFLKGNRLSRLSWHFCYCIYFCVFFPLLLITFSCWHFMHSVILVLGFSILTPLICPSLSLAHIYTYTHKHT